MITLVYGLAFGMILVLLVVPALVAMQRDVAQPLTALRRILADSRSGLRGAMTLIQGVVLGWLAICLGTPALTGRLPNLVTGLLPALADQPPIRAGLILFLAGTLLFLLVVYLLGAAVISHKPARRS